MISANQYEAARDVRAYSRKENPTEYLKRRCRELDVSYADVTKPRGGRRICIAKDKLVREVHERYPRLSMPAIGRVFGGRDHTTILHSLKKKEEIKLSPAEIMADKITLMRAHGFRQFQIVELTGLKKSQINYFFQRRGWTTPRGEKGQHANA